MELHWFSPRPWMPQHVYATCLPKFRRHPHSFSQTGTLLLRMLPDRFICIAINAGVNGFGAPLEQEQPGGSVRPILCVSGAIILESERDWTPLDLEQASMVWSIYLTSSRVFGVDKKFGFCFFADRLVFVDHKDLQTIGKVGEHNPRV